MTRWAVVFDDTPEMPEHREEFGAQHIDYLEHHRQSILVTGGLRPAPDAPFSGDCELSKPTGTIKSTGLF